MTVRGTGLDQGAGQLDQLRGTVTEVRDEGGRTVTRYGDLELVVVRHVGTLVEAEATLTGRWGDESAVLAGLRRV